MDNFIKLFSFLSLFFVLGCGDEKTDNPAPLPFIQLVSPVGDQVTEFCCFAFEWESNIDTLEFQFTLAADSLFNVVVVDTMLTDTHFQWTGKLNPGQTYFWKVYSEEYQLIGIDSFQVKDYAAYFSGNYPVEVIIEDWNFVNGVTWDTLYPGNMDIQKISEQIVKIVENTTGKERSYTFAPAVDFGDSTVVFMYNDVSRTSFCSFNFVLNTFSTSVIEGGVGSRRYYYFRGSKP